MSCRPVDTGALDVIHGSASFVAFLSEVRRTPFADWPSGWIRRASNWKDMDMDTQMLWRILGWTGESRIAFGSACASGFCLLHP